MIQIWDLPIKTHWLGVDHFITEVIHNTHHWDIDLKILRFFHGIQELFQAIALEICGSLSMQLSGLPRTNLFNRDPYKGFL